MNTSSTTATDQAGIIREFGAGVVRVEREGAAGRIVVPAEFGESGRLVVRVAAVEFDVEALGTGGLQALAEGLREAAAYVEAATAQGVAL